MGVTLRLTAYCAESNKAKEESQRQEKLEPTSHTKEHSASLVQPCSPRTLFLYKIPWFPSIYTASLCPGDKWVLMWNRVCVSSPLGERWQNAWVHHLALVSREQVYIYVSPGDLHTDKQGCLLTAYGGGVPHFTESKLPSTATCILISNMLRSKNMCIFELMEKSRHRKLIQEKIRLTWWSQIHKKWMRTRMLLWGSFSSTCIIYKYHLEAHLQVIGKNKLHHSWIMEKYVATAVWIRSTCRASELQWFYIYIYIVLLFIFVFLFSPALLRCNCYTKMHLINV